MTKNANPGKYSYFGYGSGFDAHGFFSISDNCRIGKTVIIFGADMSASVHIDNKKTDVLIYGKGPMQGLDDAALTAEAGYSINFSE